jgi:general secretion pathway protein C
MKIAPRHLIWVNLALLALVAYWGASTVSTAIAAKLTPSPEVRLNPPPPPIAHEPKRPATYYAAIQGRDIFNSTKPEAPKTIDPTPKPTELKLKLWGVVVHDDGASYCVIEDLTTRKQDLYRINDQVGGSATVKEIDWDRVILDRDGQDEILELAAEPGAPNAPKAGGAVAQQPSNQHIQLVGDNQYTIDRSEVDSALDNMSQLFTQIRAVPHFEGGQSTGFRLFAIRQNSIFDQIGLRNGDIITRINGTDLSDPSQALSLFQQLRNQSAISVDILRNKQNLTVSYQIKG